MRRFAPALVLVALTGCNSVTMVDDVEWNLDFFVPVLGASNAMHSPYVIGANIGLYAVSSDSNANMTGWQFVSDDPSVFSVLVNPSTTTTGDTSQTQTQSLSVEGVAVAAGSTNLRLLDAKGNLLDIAKIEVKVPDSAQLVAHGPLMLGQSEDSAIVTAPQIEAGGTATFLVRWFAGTTELAGNGVLSVNAQNITANPETTEWDVRREWVELTAPTTTSPQTIQLLADGIMVTSVPVNVVAPSDIDHIRLVGQNESGVNDGSWLIVLAEAFDASGGAIFGVQYTFDIDGSEQPGLGDLYRYEFESSQAPQTLTANTNGQQASATIRSGMGYVDSTNNVGCAAGGVQGSLGGLICAAVVAFRRRRAGRLP